MARCEELVEIGVEIVGALDGLDIVRTLWAGRMNAVLAVVDGAHCIKLLHQCMRFVKLETRLP